MLDELLPESLRPAARFLNPGLYEHNENRFTPDNLILDPAGVKTFLSQSIQFGEQFRKPSDMAYLGAGKAEDFYTDTSMSLRWQISTYGQSNNEQDAQRDYLKAQQLLILEYAYEERLAELNSLNASLGPAWKELDSSMGIEREDEEFMALDRESFIAMETSANWKKLLWAFSLFLPRDAYLLINKRRIADELEEAGVVWETTVPENYWKSFPFKDDILKGTLWSGRKKTYLGRIDRDVNFLVSCS